MKVKNMIPARFTGVSAGRQKGASSLEYLMLGAVVVVILVAVIALNEGDDGISATIQSTLEGLFTEVEDAATGE